MTLRQHLFAIVEREHPITVRGCFYRAVSAGLFPGTQDKHYKKCAALLKEMRKGGLHPLPYQWIVDTSRVRHPSEGFDGVKDCLDSAVESYARNHWDKQPITVEVMTEKDAMSTILAPIIRKYNVPFTVFRGNPSDTLTYNIGELIDQTKPTHVLYLGDFDPSGLNISRVAKAKIQRFAGRSVEWSRVAITRPQFERMQGQFGIMVKPGDKLAKAYVAQYGNQCVEVDAIESDEVRAMLERAIVKRIDQEAWNASEAIEKGEQAQLERLIKKIR
jgi:hypothetical protein